VCGVGGGGGGSGQSLCGGSGQSLCGGGGSQSLCVVVIYTQVTQNIFKTFYCSCKNIFSKHLRTNISKTFL
jgi:hypothetical protein